MHMINLRKTFFIYLLLSAFIALWTNAFHARSQIQQGKEMCSDLVVQTELKVFRNPAYKSGDLKFLTCRDYVNLYPLFPVRIWMFHTLLILCLISLLSIALNQSYK